MDARILELFGDATRLLGDTNVKLVEHGPFAWLETDAVLTFDVRALFLDETKTSWIAKPRNLDTLRDVIARVRPPLDAEANRSHIMRAYSALTFDSVVDTEEQLKELGDARWYVDPIGDIEWKTWHAPRLIDDKLVFFVEKFPHMAWLLKVVIDRDYNVDVTSVRSGESVPSL